MLAVNGPVRRTLRRAPHAAIEAGLPPGALGYRWVQTVDLHEAAVGTGGRYEVLEPARREENPLPLGMTLDQLPDDPDWFGYAVRDVPNRLSGETALATLPDARLAFDTDEQGDLWVGLLDARGRAPTLRETTFRPRHAKIARGPEVRIERAVWITERVFHNHSHWLTAHLPKLALLRKMGRLGELVMPERTTPVIEESLRLVGLDPGSVRRVPAEGVLRVGELTVLSTDRFRPDLLRRAAAVVRLPSEDRSRRVFVSRQRARARRLVNEEEVWPLFAVRGFERVSFEGMSFDEQRHLLSGTDMLAGPHGAGLTNQMLCPPGATVIEIADPGYPNPNFYALACALGHRYAHVPARSVGEGHRLYRDLTVPPARVAEALERACR